MTNLEMDSILISIKKVLGLGPDDREFDSDIIMHINTVFVTLNQIGVGPASGFVISDDTSMWNDFTDGNLNIENVKTYIYFKVKLMFDPPMGSIVTDSINRMASELEWRLANPTNNN